MLPTLLTARPGPQTLLLTALALLIAAATIMLACGPVAPPAADDGYALPPAERVAGDDSNPLPPAQQEGGDSAGESGDDTPTEVPPPPPKPTFTYPNIRGSGLHFDVVEFEEAQKSASGPSGQRDEAVEDVRVRVVIYLSSNAVAVGQWLNGKGVTPYRVREYEDGSTGGRIAAEVPLSLLGELSQRDGVREVIRPAPLMPGSW